MIPLLFIGLMGLLSLVLIVRIFLQADPTVLRATFWWSGLCFLVGALVVSILTGRLLHATLFTAGILGLAISRLR